MRNRLLGSILALVVALVSSCVLRAQSAEEPRAAKPRAAGSTPDLSGVWSPPRPTINSFVPSDPFGLKMQNPPMTSWGEAKFKANRPTFGANGSPHPNDPGLICLPPGVPRIYLEPHPMQIIQITGRVIVLFEFNHFFRTIYTDGREHPNDLDSTWMGHSIGRWERNTLVVDTIGFNDRTWIDRVGHPHSDELRLVERFRRVDYDTLEDNFTIDDPKAYTKPWTGQRVFRLKAGWELLEDICEDNGKYADYEKAAGMSGGVIGHSEEPAK